MTIKLNDPEPTVLDGRNIRASAFEPAQGQLARRLLQGFDHALVPRSAVTVNAGYSALPSILAGCGFDVSAVDTSGAAIGEARRRWPTIAQEYISDPATLPRGDNTIDLVWCIDTVEMTDDPEALITELARVTAHGGLLVLDTVSSTFLSRLVYLRLFQQLRATRIMPPGRYRASRLRTPDQLAKICRSGGLEVDEAVGYEPSSAPALLTSLLARRRGRITDHDLAERAGFRLSTHQLHPPVTYYLLCRKP